MSLYNEAGRRRRRLTALALLAALALGLATGFVAGRSSAGDPTAAEIAERVREDLSPVRGGLELIPTEYAQARGGAGGENAAVEGDLARIRSGLRAAAPDLRVLDPEGLARLEAAVDRLAAAVDARAPTTEIERSAESAAGALRDLPGGG